MDKSGKTIYFGDQQKERYRMLQAIVIKANSQMDELFNTNIMNADVKNLLEAVNASMVEIFEFHPRWVEETHMMDFNHPLELSTQFSIIENRIGYTFIRYTASQITFRPTLKHFTLLNEVRKSLELLENALSQELSIVVHVDPTMVASVPKDYLS